MKGKKKKGLGLSVKILMIVMIPMVVITLVLSIVSVTLMKSGMEDEAEDTLKTTCHSIASMMDKMAPGDFGVNYSDRVTKGSFVMSDNKMLDDVKNNTGVDVTIFQNDTRVATTVKKDDGTYATGTKAADVVVQHVLKGKNEYFDDDVLVVGEEYYGYYLPLKNTDGSIWGMLFAGKTKANVDKAITSSVNRIIIIAVIMFVIVGVTTIWITRKLVKVIAHADSIVETVAKGDLTVEIHSGHIERGDELGNMMRQVGELLGVLHTTIGDVQGTAETILNSGEELSNMAQQTSTSAEDISHAVEGISEGAVSQAEETAKAMDDVVKIGTMIEEISNRIERLDESSDIMKQADAKSDRMILELSESNDRTTEAMEKIASHVMETNRSVQSIDEAVEMISSIAEQTNLLSLNASIEAARAGEHGKGFAVVASEIQKLAEQSNSSARTIQDIIQQLLNASETTVKIMEEAKVVIGEQQQKLDMTKECLTDVTDGISNSKEGIVSIRSEIEELNKKREEIVDIIQNLSAISEENAASTEETTASMQELNSTISLVADSAEELKKLAVTLEEAVEYFKV